MNFFVPSGSEDHRLVVPLAPLASAPVQVAFVATNGLVGSRQQIIEVRYKAAGLRIREVRLEAVSGSMVLDIK